MAIPHRQAGPSRLPCAGTAGPGPQTGVAHRPPAMPPGVVDFLKWSRSSASTGSPWRVRWALLMALSSSVR
jgi:hypothetical protein